MVRVIKQQQEQYDVKSHLVIETCNIYQNAYIPCIHNASRNVNIHQSPFIDWYLILRVGEDASIDAIRKQYHKFALLLHPDKNKHPKAEFAFKLISQAYKCLSDNTRRNTFNLERWRNLCTGCSKVPHSTNAPSPTNPTYKNNFRNKNSPNTSKHSTHYKILQHLRVVKEQLKEEVKVIESCIRINRVSKNEYPVFDPSSYKHLSYPHRRNHNTYYKKGNPSFGGMNCDQRTGRCESPIFELRTGCSPLKMNINSTCLSSS